MSRMPLDEDDFDPTPPPRTRLQVALLVFAIQALVVVGLVRAFNPHLTSKVMDSVLSSFNVSEPPPVPPPPPPPPPPKGKDEAGKSGREGKKAIPREVKAPKVDRPISPKPAPVNTAHGTADTSGAGRQGTGTGAGGPGNGPGSGAGGTGSGGGGAVTKPSVRSGEINDSRDFPVPPGGRQTRFGKRVVVFFTVTTDGRAKNCYVQSSGVDADTTARVCPLVVQRIRFNPARAADGTPVEAKYGYKVDFTAK